MHVSRIALGCWALGGHGYGDVSSDDAIRTIHAALDAEVNTFDTADVYNFGRSEELLGKALAGRRSGAVIATKFGVAWDAHGVTRRDIRVQRIRPCLEASLRRLRTDYIDLYQVHWPDGSTPVADVIGELEALRTEGKIRAIGLTNFGGRELATALATARVDSLQSEYSVIVRHQEEALRQASGAGVCTFAYSVIGRGILTGKFGGQIPVFGEGDTRGRDPLFSGEGLDRARRAGDRLAQLGRVHGVGPGPVAIAWVLARPWIDVAIVGAKNPGQVIENVSAAGLRITGSEWATLDESTP